MKLLIKLSLIATVFLGCSKHVSHLEDNPILISQPVLIEDDEWQFEGEENLLLVPENRNNPDSRKIAIHFYRFPAKNKSTLAPVAFLGAGPGEPYSEEVFFQGRRAEAWRFELNFVNKNRDVLLINQRGNPDAPGLSPKGFRYRWKNGGSLDKAFDNALMNRNRREAYQKHIAAFQDKGMDLEGYDILHFVDDIDAIRRTLKYEKIALIGNSFGSQWALAYIQRYPDRVDRALLSGIEPLDNNYDDPEGTWNVLKKIEAYAQADPKIKNDLPKEGLIHAFKSIVTRLENQPETVYLNGYQGIDSIVVGADDLRFLLFNSKSRSYADEIESWPKYIMEMYSGDFSLLASSSIGRIYNSSSLMINPLVNNSLGISEARENLLENRSSKRWLGNLNAHYTSTRDICPSPKVPADFLKPIPHDIPMILIQGDMDLSTPCENAIELMDYLERGHLLTIKRGFHNAKRALIFKDSVLTNKIYEFMNEDFEQSSFASYKESLPSVYEMPAFEFWPIKGESLFDKYRKE